MAFPTLEQLAFGNNPIDIGRYGLKVKGLIELIRAKEEVRNELNILYDIPSGFAVPINISDLAENLSESYFALVSDETNFCGILVRSSHENEKPGQFETLPVVYDPEHPENSYEKFLAAFNAVKSNPPKAVVVQKMVGAVCYLTSEQETPLAMLKLDGEKPDSPILSAQLESGFQMAKGGVIWTTLMSQSGQSIVGFGIDIDRFYQNGIFDHQYLEHIFEHAKAELDGIEAHGHRTIDRSTVYLQMKLCELQVPKIGYSNTAIVSRSHSHIDPNLGVINMCLGLNTKLVNKADEGAVLLFDRDGSFRHAAHFGKDYSKETSFIFIQKRLDILDVQENRIQEVEYGSFSQRMMRSPLDNVLMVEIPIPYDQTHVADHVRRLSNYFSSRVGSPVELELAFLTDNESDEPSTFMKNKLYAFQLTRTFSLEEVIPSMPSIDRDRIIYPTSSSCTGSIGSVNYTGDILLIDRRFDSNAARGLIRSYMENKEDIFVIGEEFPDNLFVDGQKINYARMETDDLIADQHGGDATWKNVHAVGYLVQELHERRLLGHNAVAIRDDMNFAELVQRDFGNFSNRVSIYRDAGIVILRNATLQASKGKYQLYFNK